MYLLGSAAAPDHTTIARFVQNHLVGDAIEDLFYQMVRILDEKGEISFENLFIDGTKMEANANRYTFIWGKMVSKNELKTQEVIEELIGEFRMKYGNLADNAEDFLCELDKKKAEDGIEFVSGRGKRKTEFQRDYEKLDKAVKKEQKYAEQKEKLNGRGSYSKPDPDATFMRMKEDHMKNGQLKPAYNLQLATEGEYIVGVDVSHHRNDNPTLFSLFENMDKGLKGKRHENIVADAGYESEENYTLIENREQIAHIKPSNYEKIKTKKHRENPYLQDNMPYDENLDAYTCPAGHQLSCAGTKERKSKNGFSATVHLYTCEHCESCAVKALCTRSKGNRTLTVSKTFKRQRAESQERITGAQGIVLRINRSIQSEGTFGILKQDYGFRRYLRRGRNNVFCETFLLAMAFNVNKLHGKKARNWSGCILHELNTA